MSARTITITLTDAQYDVFVAATKEAIKQWEPLGRVRSSNVGTLSRLLERLAQAWDIGIRS